ncbi:MAG TPA: amidohydrolase family protein, partial [Chitinophagaceae bacterium]|nr:amidohydrolase family protein [Chitinophagaceae bacterium]
HQHFWKFDPVRDSWITDDMAVIQRDFMPNDLQPLLEKHGLEGCVVVQSDQSEDETIFQVGNATQHSFIKGVVGWTDLRAPNVEERLAAYSAYSKLKGFRHVLQGEQDRALMLTPDFKRGIAALEQFGFTYDILIFPDQLTYSRQLAAAFPNQLFIIDHIAKPGIKAGTIDGWKEDIKAIATLDNVYCKISGMVTEANWTNWKDADFHPYMDTVVEAFGTKRIVFGSDWPVCQVAGGYDRMIGIVKNYFAAFSAAEQALFFGGNAASFYQL